MFFPLLTYGHLNVCLAISQIVELYGDEHEIYFLVNNACYEKYRKRYPRFLFLNYEAKPSETRWSSCQEKVHERDNKSDQNDATKGHLNEANSGQLFDTKARC